MTLDPVGDARRAVAEVVADNAHRTDDPAAMAVSLRAIVEAGSFGLWRRDAEGRPVVAAPDAFAVLETYAEADLSAAFVLSQHPMFVETVLGGGSAELAEDVEPLVGGRESSAVAFSDIRRGDSPLVSYRDRQLVLDGGVSRVSGVRWASWLQIGAIDRTGPVDEVVFAFVELTPANRRRITLGPREEAAGLTGADTRPAVFDGLRVPLTHVVGRQPHLRWLAADHSRIVNSKPFLYGFGRRLLSLLRSAGAASVADPLERRLERNRAQALDLQLAAGPGRVEERLRLRLEGFGILRRLAAAYEQVHAERPHALPWSADHVARTVRILEFPATNRFVQAQARRYFAGEMSGPLDFPPFDPAALLLSQTGRTAYAAVNETDMGTWTRGVQQPAKSAKLVRCGAVRAMPQPCLPGAVKASCGHRQPRLVHDFPRECRTRTGQFDTTRCSCGISCCAALPLSRVSRERPRGRSVPFVSVGS